MKSTKMMLAMFLKGLGFKKLSESIDPNMDLIREARGLKNLIPPTRKFKKKDIS
jgi:hypothetical protein